MYNGSCSLYHRRPKKETQNIRPSPSAVSSHQPSNPTLDYLQVLSPSPVLHYSRKSSTCCARHLVLRPPPRARAFAFPGSISTSTLELSPLVHLCFVQRWWVCINPPRYTYISLQHRSCRGPKTCLFRQVEASPAPLPCSRVCRALPSFCFSRLPHLADQPSSCQLRQIGRAHV